MLPQSKHSKSNGWHAMQTSRFLKYLGIFSIFWGTLFCLPLCHGQISSWTDENGVRHFSNVETSEEKKNVKTQDEYMTDEADEQIDRDRDRFKILRMYKKDREKEKEQEALEEEKRAAEEKERELRAAEAKAAREKREACAERKTRLDDLRHVKWEEYNSPDMALIACPDRRWKGARGRVYDNMQECTERRDKARKSAYEQAVRKLEDEVKSLCGN
jgi:hypothetical protein